MCWLNIPYSAIWVSGMMHRLNRVSDFNGCFRLLQVYNCSSINAASNRWNLHYQGIYLGKWEVSSEITLNAS